jgi:Holliday junction resolvase RusA-like endonuclease
MTVKEPPNNGPRKVGESTQEPYTLEFRLDLLPRSPNELLRRHWATVSNYNKRIYRLVSMCVGVNLPEVPLTRARLTLTRVSAGKMDRDNLRSSFKAVVDGLVRCGVLFDDSEEVIGEPVVKHEAGKKGKGYITVRVEEVANA